MGTSAFNNYGLLRGGAQSSGGAMWIKSIVSLALGLRLGVIALFLSLHQSVWLFTRAPELASLAASLCYRRGLSSPFGGDTGASAFLAPGYPALIAMIFGIFGVRSGVSAGVILAMQTGFAVLTVPATMLIARSLFGARVANLAGLLEAVALPLLWVPAIFWETSLTTLLLAAIVALAVGCRRRPKLRLWVGMGVSGGVGILVNPALAPSTVGILAWTAYQNRKAGRARSVSICGPALSFAIMLVMFAPWPIRNARALHHFIPLRSNFGFELYMGNREGGNGEFDDSLFPIANSREHAEYAAKGEVAYMAEKAAIARSYIAMHPVEFVETTCKRVGWFWLGAGGRPNAWLGVAHATTTSLLGLLGVVVLSRRRKEIAAFLSIPLVFFPLPYYITHADLRFRLVLDPLLIVLAAYAIVRCGIFLKHRRQLSEVVHTQAQCVPCAVTKMVPEGLSSGSAAQSLIEVALFLPIFTILTCYAVDFGYFFLVAASMDSAARNAGEYSVQGGASTSQAAEPSAAVVSSLAVASIGLSGATSSTVSVRVCSSSVGVNSGANTTQCATPLSGAGAISTAADIDPESPIFQLNRVDIAYTVTPPVPMPAAIFPTLTFHRMVEIRSLQ